MNFWKEENYFCFILPLMNSQIEFSVGHKYNTWKVQKFSWGGGQLITPFLSVHIWSDREDS